MNYIISGVRGVGASYPATYPYTTSYPASYPIAPVPMPEPTPAASLSAVIDVLNQAITSPGSVPDWLYEQNFTAYFQATGNSGGFPLPQDYAAMHASPPPPSASLPMVNTAMTSQGGSPLSPIIDVLNQAINNPADVPTWLYEQNFTAYFQATGDSGGFPLPQDYAIMYQNATGQPATAAASAPAASAGAGAGLGVAAAIAALLALTGR